MKFILILLALTGFSAIAVASNDIKITSFVYEGGTGPGRITHLADLCGQVQGDHPSPTFAQVVVDGGHRTEGHYNVVIGKDGKFCVVVTTYYGNAEASLLP